MRSMIAILVGTGLALSACGKGGENAGAEEVRKQAEAEQKAKEASGGVAKKITPPVPGRATLPCDQVINAELFTQALGEPTPVTVETKKDPDAAASCSIMRGGKRPNEAEQKALLKKNGRLGVMNGDEICNVSTFCWTIEDADRFRRKCADDKEKDDDTQGFYSCVLIVATGADDVKRFRFYDDDTKCIIQVRGGPSNVDNDLIGKCAKAAHDLIGPAQIAVKPAGSAPAAPAGSGS
ncbi:MAG: hypothetical protein JWO36_6272 [Myxococcales bacterium]|nr:hypothetical protein [Myxococcales bacterium]